MPGQSNKKKLFTESLSEQWVSYSQSMSECIPNILLELERETNQKVLKKNRCLVWNYQTQ